jgi:hypothetical protein
MFQMQIHELNPVLTSFVQKREFTVHFTREGTFHRGNRLHGVFIIPLIQYSFLYTSE